MGQVWGAIGDKFQRKEFRRRQLRKITDRVFDRFAAENDHINADQLYITVLLVFNDINKHFPGPHNDPPSKEEVEEMMQTTDLNLDGQLDREEFAEFVKKLTSHVAAKISTNLIIAVMAAPVVALMTKRATEQVPRVGKVVEKIPNAVYASVITATVVLIQKLNESKE
ncbi:hypothetical protein SUGI_0182100 [Cryptomeria japonica]|uniref:uncharacterized protein LOC131043530 n=1 Tax=Cryptomeria japonica TaxID=3369 RepID=UPI002408E510|nr:uncharacterized protein LOC131043530 [Cryptomeria japonica]GLJ12017.1 hypothetical protein SUGI_0182100 [Cryptomeria japonica]